MLQQAPHVPGQPDTIFLTVGKLERAGFDKEDIMFAGQKLIGSKIILQGKIGYLATNKKIKICIFVIDRAKINNFLNENNSSLSVNPKKIIKHKDKLAFYTDPGLLIVDDITVDFRSSKKAKIVLDFILVKHKSDFSGHFEIKKLADSPLFKVGEFWTNKKSWEKCRNACRFINQKVKGKMSFPNFLHCDSSNDGKFYIEPEALQTLGLINTKLG